MKTNISQSSENAGKKKKGKKSYAEWIRDNGVLSSEIYDAAIRDAENDYHFARAGYGKSGESVAKSGLYGSGYSDYLSAKAYQALQKSKGEAKSNYAKDERENRQGYQAYIESLEKSESKLYSDTRDAIVAKEITSYDDAYSYALNTGLSEERASAAANEAIKLSASNIKKEISKLIINNKLSEKEARSYALFMGLSTEDAEELAKYAKSYNYISYNQGGSYLDYIQEQMKGND